MALVALDKIRARRAALAAELEQAKAEYQRLENVLRDLGRAIDYNTGGLAELDLLLVEVSNAEIPVVPPATDLQ